MARLPPCPLSFRKRAIAVEKVAWRQSAIGAVAQKVKARAQENAVRAEPLGRDAVPRGCP